MGEAKRRKQSGAMEKTIKRRARFIYLCKKYTRHSDREVGTALNVRILEGRL